MTKTLWIMRHAKSSWKNDSLEDHERPLNKRGRRDAPRMARHLAAMGRIPPMVISSTAERTRQTYALMAKEWRDEGEKVPAVEWRDDFYLAGTNTVRQRLRDLDDAHHGVMVLGHNDGWQEMVRFFSGVKVRLTTANVVILMSHDDSWTDAMEQGGEWELQEVLRPKELND